MSCSSWAKKSSCAVPRGRGRDRRTGSSGMRRDPRLSAGRPSEVTGEKPGSRLEDRSADAPLRQQTSGSSPLGFAKFTEDKVQRVTFTDPFGGFVAKHPCKQTFYRDKRWTTGTRTSRSSSRLWTLSDDLDFFRYCFITCNLLCTVYVIIISGGLKRSFEVWNRVLPPHPPTKVSYFRLWRSWRWFPHEWPVNPISLRLPKHKAI